MYQLHGLGLKVTHIPWILSCITLFYDKVIKNWWWFLFKVFCHPGLTSFVTQCKAGHTRQLLRVATIWRCFQVNKSVACLLPMNIFFLRILACHRSLNTLSRCSCRNVKKLWSRAQLFIMVYISAQVNDELRIPAAWMPQRSSRIFRVVFVLLFCCRTG